MQEQAYVGISSQRIENIASNEVDPDLYLENKFNSAWVTYV